MMPKIVLEFTDEERQLAEHAFKGMEYYAALCDIREELRGRLKHGSLNESQYDVVSDIQVFFRDATEGLLD
jgi:anti-sigma factor ChrR (cupin superfamily)